MAFSTRNAYYLRVSAYRVIPLFLYLDERHVDWMEDQVMQRVIGTLQPRLPELLSHARGEKTHKVHVQRGEGYQFCYFMRNTTRTEVVLVKDKVVNLRAPTPDVPVDLSGKGAGAGGRGKRQKARAGKTGSRPGGDDEHSDDGLRDASVQIKRDPGLDESMGQGNIKDWKPDIDVSYQGFGTSSIQVVLIIEPFPPLPASQYAPPSSRLSSRSTSMSLGAGGGSRARSSARSAVGGRDRASAGMAGVGDVGRGESLASMRNPSRAPAGAMSVYGRDESGTPGGGGRRAQTPLFLPRDTPFDEDEEDETAHEAFLEAVSEGRRRLPSVLAGLAGDEPGEPDSPGVLDIGKRLARVSEMEKRVVRVQGGWEEREQGEASAVLGGDG